MRGKRNGSKFEEILPFHKCTDADYAGFYPPAKRSQAALKEIRENPKKSLFCLDDWADNLYIGGDESITEWSAMEMIMVPCNYIHRETNKTATSDTISESCISD